MPALPPEAPTHFTASQILLWSLALFVYMYILTLRFLFKRAQISLRASAGGCSKRGRPTANVTFLIYSTWKHV